MLDARPRPEGGVSVNRGGRGSPSSTMTVMTATITTFIERLLFPRQSSKLFTCFNLLCPLNSPPYKIEFIVFFLFPL